MTTAYRWQDGDRLDRTEFFGLPPDELVEDIGRQPQIEFPHFCKPGDLIWLPPEASRVK